MTRYWPLLFLLGAIWGASFLFIKVAVEDVEPAPMMAVRGLLAGGLLALYLALTAGRRAFATLRASWRTTAVLGTFNAAVPYWLTAWGEKHIDSSVAAIAQSTVPLFTFLLALEFLPHERISPARFAGVGLGLLGVVVLAGFDPAGGAMAVVGTLALVLAAFSYASSGVFGQLRIHTAPGPVLATGSMLVGGLVLTPLALVQLPSSRPDAEALASILALTIVGTAFAQLIMFRILRLFGTRRLSLVTYLIPGFALIYGAVLLDEPISLATLGGLALILLGVALASGATFLERRKATSGLAHEDAA